MTALKRISAALANASPAVTLVFILLLSVGYRIAFFAEQMNGPMAQTHNLVNMDMKFFHDWAVKIARGDILMDEPFHPYFENHADMARTVMLDRGWANRESSGENPSKTLWDRWYNGKVFHQEPLLPYLVAAIYWISGREDPRVYFAFQMIAGLAVNALVYLTALRFFGQGAGVAAGALAVFYGPFLFFEFTLLRSTLTALAAIGLVYLGLAAFERRGAKWWAIFGFAVGLAMLLRANFIIFPALALAGLAAGARPMVFRAAIYTMIGMALALAPVVARNVMVGVNPLALAGNASFTFINGNNPHFDPREGPVERWEDVYATMARADGKLLPVIIETLGAHDGAGSYMLLLIKKLSAIFSWYEIPNNINFYYTRSHSLVLKLAPVTFFLVGPLCLAGIYLSASGKDKPWLLWAMAGALILTMMIFFPLSRYRIPLAAVLLPLAGHAVAEAFKTRRALAATALAAAVLWSAALPGATPPLIGIIDYSATARIMFLPKINEAREKEDWKTAAGTYRDWTDYEKDFGIDFDHPEEILGEILVPAFQTYRQTQASALKAEEKAWAAEAGAKADILQKEISRRKKGGA